MMWDGKTWIEGARDGQGNSCWTPACIAPGKYVATMCAGVKDNPEPEYCQGDPAQQCVDVEFDYPTTTVVRGTVGPIK